MNEDQKLTSFCPEAISRNRFEVDDVHIWRFIKQLSKSNRANLAGKGPEDPD
jgi:hypothetical protein